MIDFSDKEKDSFADILKCVTGNLIHYLIKVFIYDGYTPSPVNSPNYGNYDEYYFSCRILSANEFEK